MSTVASFCRAAACEEWTLHEGTMVQPVWEVDKREVPSSFTESMCRYNITHLRRVSDSAPKT